MQPNIVLGAPHRADSRLTLTISTRPIPECVHFSKMYKEMLDAGSAMSVFHNEVAPSQYELSPIFKLTNIAMDENTMCMEILEEVAARHGLVCLMHEKPFANVNGSGKHNNWGLNTDVGDNLFVPGKTKEQQERFIALRGRYCSRLERSR